MLFQPGLLNIVLHFLPAQLPSKRKNTPFPIKLCICICLYFTLNTSAQSNLTLPPYRQFTLRDGLSQMQVTCLMQDSRGYIWVGTKAGLNFFNGDVFVNYTSRKFPEIIDDYIFHILEDSNGKIWASTTSGVFRIDGGKLTFFRLPSSPAPSITPGKDGRIYFCQTHFPAPEYQIGYIENDSVDYLNVDLPGIQKYSSRNLFFYERENRLLFASDTILYILKNNRFEEVDHNNSSIVFFPDRKKVLYLNKMNEADIFQTDIRNSDLKQYIDGKIRIIAKIRNGQYLSKPAITETIASIMVYPPFMSALLTPDSVSYHFSRGLQVSAVLKDREGLLWIGSEEGLYQLFDNGFSACSKDILPQIWAVAQDPEGDFWFSSFMFGIYNWKNGRIRHFAPSREERTAYPYFHPALDKRGRLFFPNAYGILKVDGKKFVPFFDRATLTTFYDSERDLVWGGSSKQSVAFDAKLKVVRRIDETQGLDVGNNVLTIGKDTAGCYWFGGGSGLARYNWETARLKHYRTGDTNLGVVTQCRDSRGRTWFGSKGGLFWYDAISDSVVRLDREEFSDAVNMVSPIDSTWLLVSQPYGIYLMDLRQYYRSGKVVLYLFNEKNGFQGLEPGQDGAFTDSEGKVWMTTSTHLVKLDPLRLKTGKNNLIVRIDKCDGKKLPFATGEIELPRNQNSAVVTFDAVCFNRPNPVQYSWKLSRDTTWSAWQEEDYAVLTDLVDGHQTITVMARVKGLPMEKPAEATTGIRVRMAVYQQAWFFPALFALISFTGLILLVFALVKMKNADRNSKVFQVQAIQSQMNPHFIFNVLASCQAMILKNRSSVANEQLVKLADLVRGFLEASAGAGTIKSPHSTEGLVSLESELKLVTEFVELQQEINPEKFVFRTEIAKNVNIQEHKVPPMLIQPFIENAIRHGLLPSEREGELVLDIGREGADLLVTISDNGIGLERASKMTQSSKLRYVSRGKELTLRRIALLNKMGFLIEVHTASDQNGTVITIRIRL
jgi:hypothetical protein